MTTISPLTLLSGCLLSAIALSQPRLTLLFLLLGQASAATWWEQLLPLLTAFGINCNLALTSTSILCIFLLPSLLFLPPAEFQNHLQAVAWELLLLGHLLPSFDPLLPLKLLGSLGLLHASLLSLRLHQHRLLLLFVLSAVVWPHLLPPTKPPASSAALSTSTLMCSSITAKTDSSADSSPAFSPTSLRTRHEPQPPCTLR